MKKLLIAAAVIGVTSVPSVALARHGADDLNTTTDIRREDRQEDRNATINEDDNVQSNVDDRQAPVHSGAIKVELEDGLQARDAATGITASEAVAIAQHRFPTKTIVKVQIEREHDAAVYSVRFADNSRVDVLVSDGTIVRVRDERNGVRVDNSGRSDDNAGDDHSGQGRSGDDNSGRDHAEDN